MKKTQQWHVQHATVYYAETPIILTFVGFLSILRQGGRPMRGFIVHSKLHLGAI